VTVEHVLSSENVMSQIWFSHCNAGKGDSRGSMVPMTLGRGTCKRQNVKKSYKGDWDIYGVELKRTNACDYLIV
jgi:hypothetical protein